jgi:hypothetical protein
VIASDIQAVTPLWLDRLVWPVLQMEFDLVTPRYSRRNSEGLINRSVLSPLYRALYGKQIQNPLGPDFGLSAKLMRSIIEDDGGNPRASPDRPVLPSIVSKAVRGNFQICEAEVGVRQQPPADWMNLSSLLAQILGPVFLDMERNAAFWQRVRGSLMVPAFGSLQSAPEEGAVDIRRLIDSFQLGAKNLQDVWSLVLSPTTLLEIRRLARVPPEQFRMPDDSWVCMVCDFALAHRLRTINRDHLLRSFTPLYLGWIASYVLEMGGADQAAVDRRIEQLARAYEVGKSYLVSRWRWPDRFNP